MSGAYEENTFQSNVEGLEKRRAHDNFNKLLFQICGSTANCNHQFTYP